MARLTKIKSVLSSSSGTRSSGGGDGARENVNRIFSLRDRLFFRRKKPSSECYPFDVIDPFTVFGEQMNTCQFTLVGSNWLDKDDPKPVAIMWGFNNWKWGFVSAYLDDYRVAFAPRKVFALRGLRSIAQFMLRPDAFFVWGYTEPSWVRWYAHLKGIKIFRMEDGFLRSSMLGAAHTTPYSLIVDGIGLHYDPRTPSDLENILNGGTFSESELKVAQKCLDMLRMLELSKYNPPDALSLDESQIKTRRRVAVIGQVDNDMSVRLGNPQNWTMIELIRLAKLENPDAEVLYRPHPDVYHGFQRSKFRSKAIKDICTVVSPEEPLVDFFRTVDHVYTITSLSGLEALLRGIQVTVVGQPFYAGWGLTDDRSTLERRQVSRSLLELFAAAYLKYPRYLADLKNPAVGFKAAAFRIAADRHVHGNKLAKQAALENASVRAIAKSNYWPQLIFGRPGPVSPEVEKSVTSIDFGFFLNNAPGKLFQLALLLSVCGKIASDTVRDGFLSKVRHYIDIDVYNDVVMTLHKHESSSYVYKQLSWLLSEADEFDGSESVLLEALKVEKKKSIEDESVVESVEDKLEGKTEEPSLGISDNQEKLLRNLFDIYYAERKFDRAINVAGLLMVGGRADHALFLSLARLADLRFDLRSAHGLADFCQYIDILSGRSASSVLKAKSLEMEAVDELSIINYLAAMGLYVRLKPDQIESAFLLLKKQERHFDVDEVEDVLAKSLYLDNEQSPDKAMAFKSIDKNDRAIRIMENVIASGNNSDLTLYHYSQCLSFGGEVDKALELVLHVIRKRDSKILFGEAVRLLLIDGKFDQANKLIKLALRKKIVISDMLKTKTYFGCRQVRDALRVYAEIPFKKNFYVYYQDKYYDTAKPDNHGSSLLALAIYGPGDEIRFASIYNRLHGLLPHNKLFVSCDPRLYTLMSNSFPAINFVPVARRRFHEIVDVNDYSDVPGSDLIGALDNNGVKAVGEADQVMLVTDMLHIALTDYGDFSSKPYLLPNAQKAESYRKKLPGTSKLVGLSWRSSLTTHSRNTHYLSIQELERVFSIEGIQFVNFQYDDCQGELDWVEERFPGKLINLDEIDHYNDFDSVSALMQCMDLMVAPATTVVELAGAVGCPTWLLSNSAELHWRKIDGYGKDVWHEQTRHIEGRVLGDKSTLVDKLYEELVHFAREPLPISEQVAPADATALLQ